MKHLWIILFVLLVITSTAQQYRPFPVGNARWNEYGHHNHGVHIDVWQYMFVMNGDTLISGTNYHKVFKSGYKEDYAGSVLGSYHPYPVAYVGSIREDSSKHVYFRPPHGAEGLLYDFNLSLGDTLPAALNNDIAEGNYVSAIDSVLCGSRYHKRYHISGYTSIVEGIGSNLGLLYAIRYPTLTQNHLDCFKHNDTILYSADTATACETFDFFGSSVNELESRIRMEVFPSPSSGIVKLTFASILMAEVSVFNSSGGMIFNQRDMQSGSALDLEEHPPGIYLILIRSGHGLSASQKIVLGR